MSTKPARTARNLDVTLIQIARRQLKLTDPQYYGVLMDHAGVQSSKDLDDKGCASVLACLVKMGFVDKRRPAATRRTSRPTPAPDRAPLVRRIRAQLISLDHLPDTYADGIAKQMLGTQAPRFFEWCEPRVLYQISQALGVEQQRKGAATK